MIILLLKNDKGLKVLDKILRKIVLLTLYYSYIYMIFAYEMLTSLLIQYKSETRVPFQSYNIVHKDA